MAKVAKVSGKSRILAFLQKTEGYNTLSVRQAQARFRVANVSATIAKLRAEGYSIYTNTRKRGDGSAVAVYRLGRPSASFIAQCELRNVTPKGTN
jgi:predicted transcriptional regulator